MPAREPERDRGVSRLSDMGGQADHGGRAKIPAWMAEFAPPLIGYDNPDLQPNYPHYAALYHVKSASILNFDVEQARQIVVAQQTKDLNLHGLMSVCPDAAEAIAQHEGALDISGLTSLTNLTLAGKVATNNSLLPLDHLSALSEKIAQALGQRGAYCLLLNGLTDLSTAAALAQRTDGPFNHPTGSPRPLPCSVIRQAVARSMPRSWSMAR